MTWTCTYCHTPLPAPPLPYTLLWVCTPDGTAVEPCLLRLLLRPWPLCMGPSGTSVSSATTRAIPRDGPPTRPGSWSGPTASPSAIRARPTMGGLNRPARTAGRRRRGAGGRDGRGGLTAAPLIFAALRLPAGRGPPAFERRSDHSALTFFVRLLRTAVMSATFSCRSATHHGAVGLQTLDRRCGVALAERDPLVDAVDDQRRRCPWRPTSTCS